MSNKLDQSLDTIMTENKATRKAGTGRPQKRRAATKAKKALTSAPSGGVKKNTKVPTAPAVKMPAGDSKIIVSSLPQDVDEAVIKEFFQTAIGGVKKVVLSYGPNGRSRGEATVTFNKPDGAARAYQEYNKVVVDNRPMKIEIVGGMTTVAPAKTLSDRMPQPKNAVKENKNTVAKKDGPKPATNGTAKEAGSKKKNGGRAGRPKAKTADELDAEMADYWTADANGAATNGAATNGTAAPAATNGAMDQDEVL